MLTKSPQKLASSTKVYLAYDDVLLLPRYSEITPPETDLTTYLTPAFTLNIPVIASPMDTVCEQEMALSLSKLGSLGIIHRNLTIAEQAKQLQWVHAKGGEAGVAVGIGSDFGKRVDELAKSGARLFCIDAAHGHTKHVIEATAYLKNHYPSCEVISGNVATYEGACALYAAGADCIRVGLGPGSICSTRIVAGIGVPQLTAVIECSKAAQEHHKTLIADGGIKSSGDIVKALAAGATAVMLGFLLSGTDEAPGKASRLDGKNYKEYRGMGSVPAMQRGSAARYGLTTSQCLAPQGVEGKVIATGPVNKHVQSLLEGVRAGMAYVGAQTISQLKENACFIQQSHAALRESHPHSIERIDS
ncbi:MAG: IMP dehydrogenase [Waddliaceae bacterium]